MDEPQIIDKPEYTFVGLEGLFKHALSPETNNFEVIPPLWHAFPHKVDAIPNRIEENRSWGVIFGEPKEQRSHPDELHYIAAAAVSSADNLPGGLVAWHLPATRFACFTLRGPICNIGDHCQHIYRKWLPASPWEHSMIADIERYDGRFHPESEDSEMEYWISIQPKSS